MTSGGSETIMAVDRNARRGRSDFDEFDRTPDDQPRNGRVTTETSSMPTRREDASDRPFRRVVLKISGEGFAKSGQFGIDPDEVAQIAREISDAARTGTEIAVVVGGGNIIRGRALADCDFIAQSTADYMGMLGTVLNGMALREALIALGHECRLMSAIDIPSVAEPFIRARALRHFEKGRILILAAGTGNPFFTTDTCAALRGTELDADVLLKATKVDGVYTSDPTTDDGARRYDELTFTEAIEKKLRVMDLTALSLCMERDLPVMVFDFKRHGNILRVVQGHRVGTLVRN